MLSIQRLDSVLDKVLTMAEIATDTALNNKKFSKDFAETISVILSVAYEREKMRDGKNK